MFTNKAMLKILFLIFLSALFVQCRVFRFASHYADHMVLQREPFNSILWGFGELKANIDIKIGENSYHTTVYKDFRNLTVWKVTLYPMEAGGPYNIFASSVVDNNYVTISLFDVLFGDVWFCGGQSNMEFTILMAYIGEEEISIATSYPEIRLFTTERYYSNTTVPELTEENILQQWSVASSESINGGNWKYFSAVCWMFGRRLYDLYKVPIGLISSNYGGTRVEAWSSPSTLKVCNFTKTTSKNKNQNSVLWNAMIYPFLNTTIYGVIWYQGEHNSLSTCAPEKYSCTFPAMISGWRKEWYFGTDRGTASMFPFGFVQLASMIRVKERDFPLIRWKQTADYGFVPNPKLLKTFMAVAMDLQDNKSPFGSIHPRDKTDVAERLILGARNIAYNDETVYWTGPIFKSAIAFNMTTNLTSISVFYKNSPSKGMEVIEVRNSYGFEVLLNGATNWTTVKIVSYFKNELNLIVSKKPAERVIGLRYAWKTNVCPFKMCAVYARNSDLPSPPFITML